MVALGLVDQRLGMLLVDDGLLSEADLDRYYVPVADA